MLSMYLVVTSIACRSKVNLVLFVQLYTLFISHFAIYFSNVEPGTVEMKFLNVFKTKLLLLDSLPLKMIYNLRRF